MLRGSCAPAANTLAQISPGVSTFAQRKQILKKKKVNLHLVCASAGTDRWVGVTSFSVRVAVSSVLEHEDPHQVDQQTGHGHRKQALVVDVGRLQSSLTNRKWKLRVGAGHTCPGGSFKDPEQPESPVKFNRNSFYLDSLWEDEESCEDEEESVHEAGQDLSSDVPEEDTDGSDPGSGPRHRRGRGLPVGEAVIGPPPGDDGGCESRQQRRAVEEHVEGVWDQT